MFGQVAIEIIDAIRDIGAIEVIGAAGVIGAIEVIEAVEVISAIEVIGAIEVIEAIGCYSRGRNGKNCRVLAVAHLPGWSNLCRVRPLVSSDSRSMPSDRRSPYSCRPGFVGPGRQRGPLRAC